MFWIETLISVVNLLSGYYLTKGDAKTGCAIGVFSQIGWISLFIHTKQYGILFLEISGLGLCLMGVYIHFGFRDKKFMKNQLTKFKKFCKL